MDVELTRLTKADEGIQSAVVTQFAMHLTK